ncbi:hypothetical protein [Streptomyces sp. NPDC051132]|uniref:hypothetical protein n=1 Tax=unclassified Streptomyces TaxID=2593676 RepID=UPI00343F567A
MADAPRLQDTVALDGDGHVIAEARHRALDFLTRVQAEHGLEIVMAVAQGFEAQREPVGKRITARIALPDDPGGDITGRRPQ